MNLSDMIVKRRSVRKYSDKPVEKALLDSIIAFCAEAKPLYADINVQAKLVTKEQVRFYFPWKAPYLLAIYSENKPGYLENVGFLFQQVDLYLQSMGIGSCWMGLGKLRSPEPAPEGMEFVILLAFGYSPEDFYRSGSEAFQRRPLSEISDLPDDRLEPARLAPSSTNSQPWYFIHDGDTVHAYRSEKGLLRHKTLGAMNRIDMGIALSQLYVANADTFRFFRMEQPVQLNGHQYCGSFTL